MTGPRRQWRFSDGALAVFLMALALVATREIWLDIWMMATRDEENSYVLLAPFVALWLIWMRRDRLNYLAPSHSLYGLGLVIVGWTIAQLSYTHNIEVGWHFGGVVVVVGAALSVLGLRVAGAMIPPLLALLFLLPTPGIVRQQIALPLQSASAATTEFVLDLAGMAVIRDGNLLRINGTEVAVAEACNGMRMVSALALVTFAFVFSIPMRQRIRVTFLLLSPLVALLVNIIRLVPTVIVYGYTSTTFADRFHALSGWFMLAVALGILWSTLSLLRWLEIPLTRFASAEV